MSAPTVRRVVTGHDGDGHAVVVIDEVMDSPSPRGRQIWSTVTSPADNIDETDGGQRQVGITVPGGTVFRIGQLEPGVRSPMHRTNSVDYGLVLSGEMGMELDSGDQVRLKAGDVVVQRGTNHVWFNEGDQPAVMAWILIDAESVKVGDQVLEQTPLPARLPGE
jgi:quercetin dioxygenase-like cupin family protein